MAQVIQASFATIIAKCKEKVQSYLASDLGINAAEAAAVVKIVSDREIPNFTGDRDVLLKVLGWVSNQEVFDGAGRTAFKITRFIDVVARSRLSSDPSDSDEAWLTGNGQLGTNLPELGHLRWEESALCALVGFVPVDGADNQLVWEPIRAERGTQPVKKPGQKRNCGESSARFQVAYLKLLHQPEL